jgi:hypothetical protein
MENIGKYKQNQTSQNTQNLTSKNQNQTSQNKNQTSQNTQNSLKIKNNNQTSQNKNQTSQNTQNSLKIKNNNQTSKKSQLSVKDKFFIFFLILTGLVMIGVLILILWMFYGNKTDICSQEKDIVSLPTSSSSKIVSIPLTVLIQALEETQENFWIFRQNKDTTQEAQVEKDKEILILLLKQNLEKQQQEGNQNPQISINDLKSQINDTLKNNKDILQIVDNIVTSLESTTQPPLYTTLPPTN